MDIILSTFNAVMPLFVVLAVGYFLRQIGLLEEDLALRLNRLCFSVLIPCLLFKTTYHATFQGKALAAALYASAAFIVLTPVLCKVATHFFPSRSQAGAVANSALRPYTTLLGIPLMTNLYGEENLVCMTLILTFLVPVLNALSSILLTVYAEGEAEKPSLRKIVKMVIKNPLILGAMLGIVFNLLQIPLPTLVTKPMSDLGSAATPLAMLAMGARFNFKSFSSNRRAIAFASVLRLVAVPIVMVGGAILLGIRDQELCAIFIAAAAPTAVTSVAMCDAYGCDGKLAGEILLATSVCSCATLFLGICALRLAGLSA